MKRRTFTAEFKSQAVTLALDKNYTRKQAAASLGIGIGLLDNWLCAHRKRQNANGSAEDMDLKKRNAELEREVRRLIMERDILKKAAAYFAKDSL